MRINPLKVLVSELEEVTTQTKSGILIAPTVKADHMKGVVAVVGTGTSEISVAWQVGDTVLFNPRSGQKVKYQDKEYRLLDASEILLGGI